MPQSPADALPRHQEEEETDKTKQAQTELTYKSSKISSVFPKRGNYTAKRTEKKKKKKQQKKKKTTKKKTTKKTQEQNNTRQDLKQIAQ